MNISIAATFTDDEPRNYGGADLGAALKFAAALDVDTLTSLNVSASRKTANGEGRALRIDARDPASSKAGLIEVAAWIAEAAA